MAALTCAAFIYSRFKDEADAHVGGH